MLHFHRNGFRLGCSTWTRGFTVRFRGRTRGFGFNHQRSV